MIDTGRWADATELLDEAAESPWCTASATWAATSPRTVGSHLHNAYPKLGVSGRHQLREVVGDPP
ncbi:hypothetical protein [Amycolatopsis tucumanensis]|uniref:HTH luxR-type domain-containing protein n=1 Tax=Amycolatopsis tucumanensis TaxID=401106 RepID=A0ABP7HR57_9PSEU|nr:hypothetical protein [Amycolatopsis tucumanensis]MCF6421270.1 hypothetical protein [Amycolatopsis tucumanensis]